MSKLVYVAGGQWTPETGVGKKIANELKAFQMNGIETELILVEHNPKWKKAIPFSSSYKWDCVDVHDADYIYIRWEPVSAPFIRFLKRCKANNPHAKMVMEIGTYPYLDELKHFSNPVTIARDYYYQKFLKNYISIIFTFTSFDRIFDIPVVELVNCISVDNISVPKRQEYRDDKVINVIAVASLAYYYGFDRFLKGMADYYKKEQEYEVRFHLVGDGTILPELKELCRELKLDQYVTFYGYKTGKELDDIYELADIGIDVLGGHRKGDIWFGTLKSREYMSKGMPFITEYALPEGIAPIKKYILKEPDNEQNIDIEELVTFFEMIKTEDRAKTIENMRGFAYSYCDYRVAMSPVIDKLKE